MGNDYWKEQFIRAKKAFVKGDFITLKGLAEEVRKNRIRNGFTKAEPFMKWIEKEWLEKGLSEGVIVCRNGQYYPCICEVETEVIVGHRGRTPIVEKIKKFDLWKYTNFLSKYEDFLKTNVVAEDVF